jgi:mannan endo-1,4-beta-mannosidase
MSRARGHRNGGGSRPTGRMVKAGLAVVAAAAIAAAVIIYNTSSNQTGPLPDRLPSSAGSYLGVFESGLPAKYSEVTSFAAATGSKPDIVMYYSGWFVKFPQSFAMATADNGAVPLVQMDPDTVKVAQIVSGHYDGYLSSYAEAVRAYDHPVIISFGHEMNGNWSPWGYKHTSPKVFVAAWRHIVNVFRELGANNVTWLWTVNIVNDARSGDVTNPAPWWPGSSYVNWVGIDGYYLKSSWQFRPLFGPTIGLVHKLTADPILIAETGALQSVGQTAKINDLFNGIQLYGLLGFVYFNSTDDSADQNKNFVISSQAALAAFRKGASTYHRPG